MEIKTITCHDVYNAGASLQAYALVTYLNGLGHDARIIDYKPDYLSRHYSLSVVGNPRYDLPLVRQAYLLAKLPGRLMAKYGTRKRRFDAFREAYLPLTRRYSSFEELRADPPTGEVYLAGSDQIWNSFFQNGRDPAFYLAFAPENRVKASYAASFAIGDIPTELRPQTAGWLRGLDKISVRESSGVEILHSLGLEGQAVLDPVFLLEREHWEGMAAAPVGDAPYVLVYDFDRDPRVAAAAKHLAAENGWEIRTLQKLDYGDRCEADAGPLEFLGLIRGAQYVLSNSFHATAFSLIFERPFFVFDRAEAINTRMRDLVKLVGLEKRTEPGEPIDWDAVSAVLKEETRRAKGYLADVLKKAASK